MGTPEFPDLGKHCAVQDCKQIDFLPFTCDCCHQVYCLEHRSYIKHNCPKGNKQDVTVVICPLCAKGVRLIPDQDANITWERHVNTECDPSNYEKATNKKKCPVPRCKETLTFSNTIKCRDCLIDHCLKHRFGPDHKCPGPKKAETALSFKGLLNWSRKEDIKPNQASSTSSPKWATNLIDGISKLSTDVSRVWTTRDGVTQSSSSGSGNRQIEVCPQCGAKFTSVTTLIDHVEKVHKKTSSRAAGAKKVAIDACPKCSRGFTDPVALVEHVERDHGGTSKA